MDAPPDLPTYSPSGPGRRCVSLTPSQGWEKHDPKRLRSLPKVTELVSGELGLEPRCMQRQSITSSLNSHAPFALFPEQGPWGQGQEVSQGSGIGLTETTRWWASPWRCSHAPPEPRGVTLTVCSHPKPGASGGPPVFNTTRGYTCRTWNHTTPRPLRAQPRTWPRSPIS